MQLVAYGAQDVYLTGNPQITFWKVTYRRYTNFAMESIEQTFNGQAGFGRRVTCTISRNGDLASKTYLQITLPEIADTAAAGTYPNFGARWLDMPGYQLIAQVEVEIGGQRIDRQYGDWMAIWTSLTESSDALLSMLGQTTRLTYLVTNDYADVDQPCGDSGLPQTCAPRKALPETTLYVPLMFWFTKNPGLALPLIALQYHEVKINIDFRPLDECLWAVTDTTATTASPQYMSLYNTNLVAASLYIDYIFLDTDERRRMAQNPHEYLIEQLQFTGDESVGSSSNKIKLNFNHPCKELIWVVQPDANVDYCSSFVAGDPLFTLMGAQPFNYTDALDVLPNTYQAFATSGSVTPFVTIDTTDSYNNYFAQGPAAATAADASVTSTVGDASTFVLAETALPMHCWGSNPVVVAKLQLNGQDRFSEREGTYFDVVQPYQFHSECPSTGINVYSFSLKPEEHQPSGTCNFSRIDNATLQLVLSNETVKDTRTAKVRVYATNYNVLRIMSGMGGLAYSN